MGSAALSTISEFQIRGGFEDNLMLISYFSMKTYVVTPHYNRLIKTVLMMGHKICLYGEMGLIIAKLSLLPLLLHFCCSLQSVILSYMNLFYSGIDTV